ncbi:MAG: karyopherin beta [Chrysothrix sp. TS-e1954]|nr:MAG: karyopherin beta [Chrysothrix sp. TS-e1954]
MDVNRVLTDTLSPDTSIRSNAEQQLSQAAEGDFSGYLQTLAQELANDQSESNVRMAAGLALKNLFSAREFTRLREVQARWLQQIDSQVKSSVKSLALRALTSNDSKAGLQAAQFVAAVAAIELPRDQWPELMQTLVQNVNEGQDAAKQASLSTIGFICENQDETLQESLSAHSNTILTAVVQGARKEEPSNDVRAAAMTALGDSLEFVRSNFENEGERNFIMQVVCEATQASDTRIMQQAYGCLNRIMALYYDKMFFYMEKALFGLTIQGMKHEEEDVAKLAVEFWCTVCEEEIAIEDDNVQAQQDGTTPRPFFNFARIATQEVVPVLLELLTKQDEDASDEEYNTHKAAYQCLSLWSQAVGNGIVAPVLQFIETNIQKDNWHLRDAAVSAFGAIMEGPETKMLDNIVKQGLPMLISMMNDSSVLVKDSVAFTMGRICECVPDAIDAQTHLQPLISSLFQGLSSSPRMASSCCWALMNLADRFAGDIDAVENQLTPHFDDSVTALLNATERNEVDGGLRTAAYEVLSSFINNAASNSNQSIASVSNVLIERLEGTVSLRRQVISVEDKLTLDDMQTSLCTVLMSSISKLDKDIKPQADRIMNSLLQVLSSLPPKSSVSDSVFAAIGALANAMESDFQKYMEAFNPYLSGALSSKDEPSLCAMAVGLVSDVVRALGPAAVPYCNDFMNHLLENLRSTILGNQFKPAILQSFGDIAQAIGGAFEMYLPVVAQVLSQATNLNIESNSYEMMDYIISLREGIVDAWAGAIIAMKGDGKVDLLREHLPSIFEVLRVVAQDQNRSEPLLRSAMGVIGDLAEAFPSGEYNYYFQSDWLLSIVKEVKSNREFSMRTATTAKWAREQLRRQPASYNKSDRNASSNPPETRAAEGVKLFCDSASKTGDGASAGDDVLHLPMIVDAAESSPHAAASAAYQIRKVLTRDIFMAPARQYNAIMLIRILTDNPGPTFTRAIDSKFVEGVRNVLRQSRDPSVQQIMRETLNNLESDKGNDENLTALIKMWKKEKETGPGLQGPASPRVGHYGNRGVYRPPGAAASQVQHGSGRQKNQLPEPVELAGRIEEAKTTAKLLVQLTLSTPADEFQGNELLKEFSDRSQSAQRSLQGYMNSTDPPPDEATFQTLIETCEMLSVASSKHQRALLAARRQAGAVSPGVQSQQPLPSPSAETTESIRSPSIPQSATKGQSFLSPTSAVPQNGTVPAAPTVNPFGDENRSPPPDNTTQRYYSQTPQRTPATFSPNAVELDGTTKRPDQPELDGEETQTSYVSKEASGFVPPLGPPPTKRNEEQASRPSTGGTSDDLYSEHPTSTTQRIASSEPQQPYSPAKYQQSSQQPSRSSVPPTPLTGSSGINSAAYPPRNTSVDMQTPLRSPPKLTSPQGQWGEESPDVARLSINGSVAGKPRMKDDDPMTPQMPVSGSGWSY